jgi:hypothetical protein
VVDGTSALNDKSEPGPRQLTTVEGVSALNDKRKSGPKKLSVGEVISLLNVKIVVEIAPEEEAEEDSASGAMNDAPGAEHASGGGMAIGGQVVGWARVAALRSLSRRQQRQQRKSSSG